MQNLKINNLKRLDYRTQESFNRLRTNIQLSGEDIKTILVTSCIPNDGKSFVGLRMAVSLADLRKRVLFIDADLRHSVLNNDYKITNAQLGLTHYLTGSYKLEDIIGTTDVRATNSTISYLNVILSGPVPPNPSELLTGKKFAALLEYARENYDYVVIDSAPLANVVDASIISAHTDGTVLVLAAKAESYKLARKVVSDIQNSGNNLLGVVLNKVHLEDKSVYGKYYGSYYGSYYGKYYGNDEK